MTALHPDAWAAVLGEDLAEFVGAGGAMVRFAVGESPRDIAHAKRSLEELAVESPLIELIEPRIGSVFGAQS